MEQRSVRDDRRTVGRLSLDRNEVSSDLAQAKGSDTARANLVEMPFAELKAITEKRQPDLGFKCHWSARPADEHEYGVPELTLVAEGGWLIASLPVFLGTAICPDFGEIDVSSAESIENAMEMVESKLRPNFS